MVNESYPVTEGEYLEECWALFEGEEWLATADLAQRGVHAYPKSLRLREMQMAGLHAARAYGEMLSAFRAYQHLGGQDAAATLAGIKALCRTGRLQEAEISLMLLGVSVRGRPEESARLLYHLDALVDEPLVEQSIGIGIACVDELLEAYGEEGEELLAAEYWVHCAGDALLGQLEKYKNGPHARVVQFLLELAATSEDRGWDEGNVPF